MTKLKRHHIADLLDLKKLGLMDDDKINKLRQQRLVIEPRGKEVRYVPNTTLIPHFAYKNASVNELNPEAIQLKMEVDKLIVQHTITKKFHDDAIAEAEKQLEDERIKKDQEKLDKPPKKTTKKSTTKK